MENPYEPFIRNVRESLETVLVVARWAVLRGNDVTIKGMKFASGYEEWEKCADGGADILINDKAVNVKGNSRSFYDVDGFAEMFSRFPRPILVSATHAAPADFYFIVNADKSGAMVISKKSKDHWGRRVVYDGRYDTEQECFDVSPEHVRWVQFEC